jgi:hypothetical protein
MRMIDSKYNKIDYKKVVKLAYGIWHENEDIANYLAAENWCMAKQHAARQRTLLLRLEHALHVILSSFNESY